MKCIKIFVLILIIVSKSAESSLVWSFCTRDHQKWQKPAEGFVQNWLSSVHVLQEKSPFYPLKVIFNEEKHKLKSISRFDAEKGSWFGWKIASNWNITNLDHLGYLYGSMDDNGTMSGPDITYIYPDFKTVLVGEFKSDVMIKAKPAKIKAYKCLEGLLHLMISNPKPSDPSFEFSESTEFRIDNNPTVIDPFEKQSVYCKDGPYGDSLHAKKSFKKGELVSYYSGIRIKGPLPWANMTEDEKWDFHKNLINLYGAGHLNVPKEYWSLHNFRATLGHKVNHSFLKANVKFDYTYHPRFGYIRSIVAIKDVAKNEELAVNYGYGTYSDNVPQWYKEAYEREFGKPYRK